METISPTIQVVSLGVFSSLLAAFLIFAGRWVFRSFWNNVTALRDLMPMAENLACNPAITRNSKVLYLEEIENVIASSRHLATNLMLTAIFVAALLAGASFEKMPLVTHFFFVVSGMILTLLALLLMTVAAAINLRASSLQAKLSRVYKSLRDVDLERAPETLSVREP